MHALKQFIFQLESAKIDNMALEAVHKEQKFAVGDTVRVHQLIEEFEKAKAGPAKADAGPKGKLEKKTRTQIFEGTVIGIKGAGVSRSFTVRRLAVGGIGVERIFPLASPFIEKVEVAAKGAVRRAKLYYLRGKPAREVAEITKRYARKSATAHSAKAKRGKPKAKIKADVKRKSRKTGGRSGRKVNRG